MKELIAAYDEYVALLALSEASLLALAVEHGYEPTVDIERRGMELRVKIAELKRGLT
jgi:hypothetical protein